MASTMVEDAFTVCCTNCGEQVGQVAYAAWPAEEDASVGYSSPPSVELLTSLPEGKCEECGVTLDFETKQVIADILTHLSDEERAAGERFAEAIAEDAAAGEGCSRPRLRPVKSSWQ